jgi:MFS family permease
VTLEKTDFAAIATPKTWIGLAVVLGATFMGQVDGFIVTVAAPSIQRDLPASFSQIQFIGASYVLACAAGLITGGRLGDLYGRRRMFLIGVGAFTLASAACGFAPNAEILIAARFVQGAAAALLVPQELALIRNMFLDEGQRNRAISIYGVVLGIGVIAGLAGGGLLVYLDPAGLGWRSAFLINVPIGLLIMLLGHTIGESRVTEPTRLDLTGAALTAVALPALLLPIVFGTEQAGARWIWLCPVVGVLLLLALAAQQEAVANSGGAPLFPPRILRLRGMPIGLAAIMTFFAGNAGLFLVFTYYVQTGLGMRPLIAGLMFVPLGIGFIIGSARSDRLVTRFGTSVPVAGCVFLSVALLCHLLVVLTPPVAQHFLLAVVIGLVGLAQGLVVSPLIAGIFSQVAPEDAGALSGVASTLVQFGLAAGFASIGSWYRLVLGGTPGAPDAPSELGQHVRAYTAAVVVLTMLALATCVLCALRDSSRRGTGDRPKGQP